MTTNPPRIQGLDFIRKKINEDIKNQKNQGQVITRFPPEPNGYLHIGHAKSICLNFGLAIEYKGRCHLRLDDTNPEKEDQKYIEAIKKDVNWLGFDYREHLYYASDYFEKFYAYAMELIKKEKAYVCSLSSEEIRSFRGTLTTPGKNSPYRQRSITENLDLFEGMRKGEFEEGACVLRAKIDMAHPNINMRDPALYRIRKIAHPRTGEKWCIYPMYDFAHCISDAIEKITHSICTLEFEDHRPLYDWILDNITIDTHPQQIEFARLELTHTIMSKRKLKQLVADKHVNDWDDPRMPTICGLRRRGYTPEAIQNFCRRIGVDKTNSLIDIQMLEYYIREELNKSAPRAMAVLEPLKVVITNYPENQIEEFEAIDNPEDPDSPTHKIPFSRTIYIEKKDFHLEPPKNYFRLALGREVRLKFAYYITCQKVITDPKTNEITELHCTYDPESRGGGTPDNRRVKGTLQWISQKHALSAEIRLYDNLLTKPKLSPEQDLISALAPNSLVSLTQAQLEPWLSNAQVGQRYQFMRQGYFCVDPDSQPQKLVFNRIVQLKDTWAKLQKRSA